MLRNFIALIIAFGHSKSVRLIIILANSRSQVGITALKLTLIASVNVEPHTNKFSGA